MGCTSSSDAGGSPNAPKGKGRGKEAPVARDRRMCEDTPLLQVDDFTVGAYIQTGAMGKVYKGERKADGKAVALKFFGYTDKTPDVNDAYEEINLMTALRGVPGMVQLYGVFMDPAQVTILFNN
jgi:serine/threonine protein kinase